MRNKQKGFSLIELLIVVAIILIIAAIAIPNLIKSKMAANESSAVGSLRTLNTAEVGFSAQCPDVGFANTLAKLGGTVGDCTGAGLIDSTLQSGIKSGYTFVIGNLSGATPETTYSFSATPQSTSSGKRGFYTDQTGVIRYDQSGTATAASSALQ
jgi:type IV pilus assembly protein PilA